MTTVKAKGPTFSDLIESMKNDFEKPFYQSNNDLKAAYAVGVYLNSGMYFQRTKLRTRGLVKKLRYLLDNLDRRKILKIFSEVSKVMIAVHAMDQDKSLSDNLREKAETFLTQAEWTSTSEELTLALVMGLDLYSRLWRTAGNGEEDTKDE